MSTSSIINKLASLGNKKNLLGMEKFGINTEFAFGIRIPILRTIAKSYKNDHILAMSLWETKYHEARILASMIANPKLLTSSEMNNWVKDFNSWDLCDQVCSNLFAKSELAVEKIEEFSTSDKEFVKRAGFALMASFVIKGKKMPDEVFIDFFPIIEREAWDNRKYVKKAINWALRQIGKKNRSLCESALQVAERVKLQQTASAKWIANDAIRELNSKLIFFSRV